MGRTLFLSLLVLTVMMGCSSGVGSQSGAGGRGGGGEGGFGAGGLGDGGAADGGGGTADASTGAGGQGGQACPLAPTIAHEDYSGGGDKTNKGQLLDVYLPSGTAPLAGWPVFIHFVGGGFVSSDKDSINVCPNEGIDGRALAAGFAVAVVEYRIAPVLYPENERDGQRAVQWLRHQAPSWGLDADKMVAMGRSASGIVAQYVALGPDAADPNGTAWQQRSSRVRALINMSGASDFSAFVGSMPNMHFPPAEAVTFADVDAKTLQEASSIHYAFRGDAAVLNCTVPVFNAFQGPAHTPPIEPADKHDAYFGQILQAALAKLDKSCGSNVHQTKDVFHHAKDGFDIESLFGEMVAWSKQQLK